MFFTIILTLIPMPCLQTNRPDIQRILLNSSQIVMMRMSRLSVKPKIQRVQLNFFHHIAPLNNSQETVCFKVSEYLP